MNPDHDNLSTHFDSVAFRNAAVMWINLAESQQAVLLYAYCNGQVDRNKAQTFEENDLKFLPEKSKMVPGKNYRLRNSSIGYLQKHAFLERTKLSKQARDMFACFQRELDRRSYRDLVEQSKSPDEAVSAKAKKVLAERYPNDPDALFERFKSMCEDYADFKSSAYRSITNEGSDVAGHLNIKVVKGGRPLPFRYRVPLSTLRAVVIVPLGSFYATMAAVREGNLRDLSLLHTEVVQHVKDKVGLDSMSLYALEKYGAVPGKTETELWGAQVAQNRDVSSWTMAWSYRHYEIFWGPTSESPDDADLKFSTVMRRGKTPAAYAEKIKHIHESLRRMALVQFALNPCPE